jgi:hypothetical protein
LQYSIAAGGNFEYTALVRRAILLSLAGRGLGGGANAATKGTKLSIAPLVIDLTTLQPHRTLAFVFALSAAIPVPKADLRGAIIIGFAGFSGFFGKRDIGHLV